MEAWPRRAWTWAGSAPPWRRRTCGLRCWEADPPHKFRNKRQRGRGSPTAQAAGPLARRWRLSRHRNEAERMWRSRWGRSPGIPASSPTARTTWVIPRTTWVIPEMVSRPRCPVHSGPSWVPRSSSQAARCSRPTGGSGTVRTSSPLPCRRMWPVRAVRATWPASRRPHSPARARRTAASRRSLGRGGRGGRRLAPRGPTSTCHRLADQPIAPFGLTWSAPAPGKVPATSTRARRPPAWRCRRYRYSAPGSGHDVIQRVGRGDGRAGRAQHADLKRQQQHRAGDACRRGQHSDDICGRQGDGLRPARPEHSTTISHHFARFLFGRSGVFS